MLDVASERPRTAQGMVAAFAADNQIVAAARALHEQGYTQLDAFVPRPIVALEELIAPERSTLPRSVFVGALLGAVVGLAVQWFCNTWDFPLNVGGRPPFSLPAFIPITFEMMVLFGALTAFFGVLHRMHLPRLADPIFEVPGFESTSIDQFWLYVSASDPQFHADRLVNTLREHGCVSLSWTKHRGLGDPRPTAAVSPGGGVL